MIGHGEPLTAMSHVGDAEACPHRISLSEISPSAHPNKLTVGQGWLPGGRWVYIPMMSDDW